MTVITVTKNRRSIFPIAIDNWTRLSYAYDKIKWLIIDDSDTIDQSPIYELKNLRDSRIKFYKTPQPMTIGAKRNLAMSLIDTDYAVMMDDDDFLYSESVLLRICALKVYMKGCIYSDHLDVYNTLDKTSYTLEKFKGIPEGSVMLTKKYWSEHKFTDSSQEEGNGIIFERDMLRIPCMFNMVSLVHSSNTSGNCRNVNVKNIKGPDRIDYWKYFPESTKEAITKALSS